MPVERGVKIGDLVEIDGRRDDVVSDQAGGVALEPAITQTVAEIHAEHGGRPLTSDEFDELLGDLPSDGEGCAVSTGGRGAPRLGVRIRRWSVDGYPDHTVRRGGAEACGDHPERPSAAVPHRHAALTLRHNVPDEGEAGVINQVRQDASARDARW